MQKPPVKGGFCVCGGELRRLRVSPPSGLQGQVKAFVAPREGESLTPEEVLAFLREKMARYKWPREVEIMEELPKGPTGKILKRELKDRAAHI